jgi:hypothetical protein
VIPATDPCWNLACPKSSTNIAAELARQLNRAPATLERWRKRRIGPAPTMVGKTPYYKMSTVQAWLQAQERTPVCRANPDV